LYFADVESQREFASFCHPELVSGSNYLPVERFFTSFKMTDSGIAAPQFVFQAMTEKRENS
jgi:hypothetical protein